VLCSQCASSLPDDAQFCKNCGQPVYFPQVIMKNMAATSMNEEPAILGCSHCGAELPDGAQFCLKCGKPVAMPPKKNKSAVEDTPPLLDPSMPEPPRPKRKNGRLVTWALIGLVVIGIGWAAVSDNPFAQEMQDLVGWKHDHAILDEPFSVGAHSFRYYKFALPEGSLNVAIVGQFTASDDGSKTVSGKSPDSNKNKEDKDAVDNNIEVYVLSEPAFTVWQNGYATSSVYESGRVSSGTMQAELPAGAGIYYLVFNNKFAPKTPKSIDASVSLQYKSWLPESFRRMKNSVLSWFGL
jgi:ribosomal protein L40E